MRPIGHTKARRRARSRGLTLLEMMIVITLIGALTAAIAVGVMGVQKKANIRLAQTACDTIRSVAIQWKALHPGDDCPTIDNLRAEKDLDRNFNAKDAWGVPYKLSCDAEEVTCSSSGPDKKDGTDDDIVVPRPDK